MSRTLFIGRRNAGEKNDVALLADSIGADYGFFDNLILSVSRNEITAVIIQERKLIRLTDYNLIVLIGWSHNKIYTDLAAAVASHVQHNGIEVWNSELINSRSMTKVSQVVRAALNGL